MDSPERHTGCDSDYNRAPRVRQDCESAEFLPENRSSGAGVVMSCQRLARIPPVRRAPGDRQEQIVRWSAATTNSDSAGVLPGRREP